MSHEQLDRLAAMCGGPLPPDYVRLLNDYPPGLLHAMRAIDDSDSEGSVAQAELLSSLDCVLALNVEVREDSLVRPDGVEIVWPDQFAVIGESASGDYFCLDVEKDIEGVIQYDHQAVEFFECAESLEEYVEMLMETFVFDGESDAD